MIKHTSTSLLTLVLAIAVLAPEEGWAMRCGSFLVNEGDPQSKVLRYCGEPATKTSRYALRPGTYRRSDSGLSVNGSSAGTTDQFLPFGQSEVLVEEWTYNFGPRKLMRLVRFANGFVEEVLTLDYGYREND